MPKAFSSCVRRGGRVRTKGMSGGRYVRYCFKGGRSYRGHVKRRKRRK